MTPQSQFTIVAAVTAGRVQDLRRLLEAMNAHPGMADPKNAIFPFGEFDGLHYARFAILDDPTLEDMEVYGRPKPRLPVYLAFLGDCDGPSAQPFLAKAAKRAGDGLRQIFRHCQDFDEHADLMVWMLAHDRPIAAAYVSWVGRTVRQIREESHLQRALSTEVRRVPVSAFSDPQRRRRDLIEFVDAEVRAGRLSLTPPESTPIDWLVLHILHLIGGALIGLIGFPVLMLLSPLLIWQLRMHEKADPEVCPRPTVEFLITLKCLEDHDVTNQYTAFGLVKPGLFRRWLVTIVTLLIDYSCRHVFNRGHLARVQTIHFARWVFLDDKARVMFASNYDGGHEAYMDDFINKVAWGLNLVFSNGVGWPRTEWLIKRGARIEHKFKYFQRRHQLPTNVWYKAYPGLALVDINRNQRIRDGLAGYMSDAKVLEWLRLL